MHNIELTLLNPAVALAVAGEEGEEAEALWSSLLVEDYPPPAQAVPRAHPRREPRTALPRRVASASVPQLVQPTPQLYPHPTHPIERWVMLAGACVGVGGMLAAQVLVHRQHHQATSASSKSVQ